MLRVMIPLIALLLAPLATAAAPISSEFDRLPARADAVAAIPADGGAGLPGASPRPYILILNDAAGDLRPWKYHPELSRVFELRFLALSARQPDYLISGSAGSGEPHLLGLPGGSFVARPEPFRTPLSGTGAAGVFLRIGNAQGTESLGGKGATSPDSAPPPVPVSVPVPVPAAGGTTGLGLALGLAAFLRRLRAPSAGSSQ